MSTSTQNEEDEIHDLVLLFANSRIPRGSDAFQSIIGDLLPAMDQHSTDENDSSDSNDSHTGKADKSRGSDENPSGHKETKSVRMVSPKPLARVHWPDEINEDKLSSSPTPEKLHSARIYMKTTPKPILKHDDNAIIVDHIPQGQG